MPDFCKNCGTELRSGIKFCSSCGTKMPEVETSPEKTTDVISKVIIPKVKKPRSRSGKLLFSVIAGILIVAIAAALLGGFGKPGIHITGTIGDLHVFAYSGQDYRTKAKALAISPQQPSTSAYGARIDFGEYGLQKQETLEIKKLPEKIDKKNGVKLTAYDFHVVSKPDFNDVITITLPYDVNYVEEGAEGECVGAKYYNQTTGEWESVYYEVDAANRQVLIYTTHLSTYGVFQVKNENTRKAYITDVYAVASLLGTVRSLDVLEELAAQGQPGNAAFEAGFEAINYVVGNTGNAVTVATLGGQYEGALAEALGKGTQHLGLALAAVQTCYDFSNNFSDDKGKLSTLANLTKNIAGNTVGYFGWAQLQVGFTAVAVFDMILSTVQSDMMELKLENLGEVYQYYNEEEEPRPLDEWRTLFIGILKKNSDDPQEAQKLIEAEIDTFCDRFWHLQYHQVKEIAGVSGKKYSFDERTWTKDREVLTAQYKDYLLQRLQAPLTSARKELLNKAQEQAQIEFEKQLRSLQKELNKTVSVQIIEQPEKAGEFKYSGFTVRFAPLSGNANVKSWSGKMPQSGELNTSFTVIGHMQSGSPNRIELYAPGRDTPELTIPFQVSYPVTTIVLKGEDEEKNAGNSADDEQATPPSSEKEYAWVLIDTRTNDWQGKLAAANKSTEGHWKGEVSASAGGATFTYTFTGNTDGSFVNGMAETGEVSWTAPSLSTIKPDEEFSLTLGVKHISSTRKYPNGGWSVLAQIIRLDEAGNQKGASSAMADKNGQTSFSSGSGNKFQSFNPMVYGKLGRGSATGEQIAVQVSASGAGTAVQTFFVYEWKEVGSAAPSLNTTGIEGIVDIP